MPTNTCVYSDSCNPSIKTFRNNISTKMAHAQMIKTNSKRGIPLMNSRIETIYKIIREMDIGLNKKMLITFKYSLYSRYYNAILNGLTNQSLKTKLVLMLEEIVDSLTLSEYNRVFEIIVEPTPEPVDLNPVTDYTFYVMTRVTTTISYFIIKNIRDNFFVEAGKKYTFDLSDPSNLGTRFALSYSKNGISVPGVSYINLPGNSDAKLIYDVPLYLANIKVFIFNNLDRWNNKLLDSAYVIWGYNNPYIVTNIGVYLTENLRQYITKYVEQDSTLSIFESDNGPQYYIITNGAQNPELSFRINLHQYAVSYGTYYLYIPRYFEATLLNAGFEDCISFVGDTDKISVEYLNYISLTDTESSDGSYNFYWGTVAMTVHKPFEKRLSFYSKKFGYMDGIDLLLFLNDTIAYGNAPTTFNYVTNLSYEYYGLCCQNKVNLVDGTYITFNDHLTYSITRRYNLYLGEYLFFIPQTCPIAILNTGKTDIVVVEGLSDNTFYYNLGPDGLEYRFYYGFLKITINGNFGFLSFCGLKKGYMGGYKIFGYDASFNNSISYPDPLSVPTITELSPNTTFDDISGHVLSYTDLTSQTTNMSTSATSLKTLISEQSPSISYNTITLQGGFSINGVTSSLTMRFRVTRGIYILSLVDASMAIMNNSIESNITYTGGGVSFSAVALDGNTYTYYKDYLIVYVFSPFGFVSFNILGTVYQKYTLGYF